MTWTEDRLTAALKSAAAAVRVQDAPSLTAPGPHRPGRTASRPHGAAVHRRRGRMRLAALGAVAAIAAVSVALRSHTSPPGPVVTAAYIGGSEPHVPAFFVDAGSTGLYDQRLRVVSLATGAVTATEHAPPGTQDITFLAEQAQTGNYLAAFDSNQAGGQVLYRFSITGTGTISSLTRIKGITLSQRAGNLTVLALSPSGSRLALSLTSDTRPAPGGAASEIIELNLRTGARQAWKDTLADRKYYPAVTSAVWTPDGHGLVFASNMCRLNSATGPCFWEFRSLHPAGPGGGLQAGPVLLRQHGMSSEIQAPAISADGSSLVEIRPGIAAGSGVTLVRISLATRGQVVLHRWLAPGTYQVGASEGNFLIVGQQLHSGSWVLHGWIDDRGFHPMRYPPAT